MKRLETFRPTDVKPLWKIGKENLLRYLDMSYKFDWRLRKKSIEKLSNIDDSRARNRIRELTLDEATLVRMYACQYCKLLKILSENGQPIRLLKMQSLSFLKEMKQLKKAF